ncbi:cysteine protease ATG4D isoform X2 [Pseudomyrmex gracilis]|uniref:cysteine protease ATG4D isoform X2 n=1 Tax=Pseudomyrmex gracilis TaxID=219809 RepID=UPI000995CC4E|nr:cysteine protease ATG4D isoform X2 [Pseudomyrmex gracilis]
MSGIQRANLDDDDDDDDDARVVLRSAIDFLSRFVSLSLFKRVVARITGIKIKASRRRRERSSFIYFTGFSSSGLGFFSGMVATDRVPNIQQPFQDAELSLDDSTVATEVDSKVKTKLLSMWNNVKYGWTVKMKTNFSKESPVWLLGQCYLKKSEDPLERASEALEPVGTGSQVSLAIDATNFENTIEEFKRDFVSRLWLTYRREFPILNGSTFTTDCGWGCMLRSGQMMLAQALVCHFLGREWRWRPEQPIETTQQRLDEYKHRMIIKWFGDQPTLESPFSIHRLVSLGASTGKRAGDWYGPSSVAHLLCQAVQCASEQPTNKLDQLAVYVAQDCAVYLQDVENICRTPDGKWKALILLVPLRLGVEKLNPVYAPCVTSLLTLSTCIGMIGGRPRHSLYFVGYQDDKLIHLDPHYCQETVDVWKRNFSLTSFHCTSPRKMLLSKMDPSCCVGFYFPNKESLTDFMETIQQFVIPSTTDYPMFLFCEGSGKDLQQGIEVVEDILPSASPFVDPEALEDDLYECEEFELLH